jgi:CubicO group peptidase (beta-lactamase class C family)
MAKPVTSVAIMMLAERGLLDLDDPLECYLPQYAGRAVLDTFDAADSSFTTRSASGPITLRHLLTHTAGFGYDFSNSVVLALCRDKQRQDRDLPLLFDPGSRWAYGCATAILGHVIEQVTGEPFYHFFDSQILHPLGMSDTTYFVEGENLARLLPLCFRKERGWIKDPSTKPHAPYLSADGGLLGTADDYIRFLQMLLNGGELGNRRLLSAASVAEMTRNQIGALTVERQVSARPKTACDFPLGAGEDKFGLGFQIKVRRQTNRRLPGSYSWGGVFNTHFWVDPQAGIAATFFTQLLPFCDEQVMAVLDGFEELIYQGLH